MASMWGTLGRFAEALMVGDVEAAAQVLTEDEASTTATDPAPPPDLQPAAEHADGSPGCGFEQGGMVCTGHTSGACIMLRKEGAAP